MNLTRLIQEIKPDEIRNLEFMSYDRLSVDTHEHFANVDRIGI